MVYTFNITDNSVPAMDNPSNTTVKIIEMNKNQCHAEVLAKKPPVAQLLIQLAVFYTIHQFITIFPTAPLTPSHPIPLAHPPSVLTYILH